MKFNLILISTIFLLIALKIDLIQSQVTSYTVKFLYQVSGNSQNYQPIQPGYLTNKSLKTKFLVHGFTDNGNQSLLRDMAQAIFSAEGASNVYVIIVDWAEGAAGPLYNVAVDNTKNTGQQIANFVNSAGLNTANVHCIGHSLGAHCCGQFGKSLWNSFSKRLGRISGLDPAGPLFWDDKPSDRLDKTDASKVDVIHTDINACGYANPLGHKDFYPNDGKNQPGCEFSPFNAAAFTFSCSHSRAVLYYTESIRNPNLCTTSSCSDWTSYTWGFCPCFWWQSCTKMGYYAWGTNTQGRFYTYVNSASLFCR